MSDQADRPATELVEGVVKQLSALSRQLCPAQRDLEHLAKIIANEHDKLKHQIVELKEVHKSKQEKIGELSAQNKELTTRIQKLEDKIQESDRVRARMERYQKERDQLRDEKLHWESEKVALGHRFLNWALKNHTLSSSTSADLAVRAWMHDEKLLANDGASADFGNTDGFTICPGGALAGVELFEVPEPPKKTPGRDDLGHTIRPPEDRKKTVRVANPIPNRSAQIRPNQRSPTKPAPTLSKTDTPKNKSDSKSVSADSSKPAGSNPTAKSPTKPAPTPSKKDTPKNKPRQDSGEHDFVDSDLNFGENSRRPKPASEPSKSTALSKSKKRPGDKPLPSSSKRQKSSKTNFIPTLKDMFGSDDSDDGMGSIVQSLKKVYEKVYKSKPWRRYWYATGPFLPDLPYSEPRLPKDKEAVDVFNEELADFWKHCAEDVWARMFTIYQGRQQSMGTLDLSSDSIGRRVVHPDPHDWVIGVSESLVRFLCHPHPSWPQVFKKPTSLPLIAKQMSVEVAINYLKSESKKFWPDVPLKSWSCPLGSTFAIVRNKTPGKSVAQVVARRLHESLPNAYGDFDREDHEEHVRMTKEAIEFVYKAASDDVTEPGFWATPTTLNPMCLYDSSLTQNGPRSGLGKSFIQCEADFWSHQPEIERMLDSPEEEENPDIEDQESVHAIEGEEEP
ncbi:unnamed protein product [Aphanomyces euteiches]